MPALLVPFQRAFRADIEPFSGGWIAVGESVRRSIAALIRSEDKAWIGIASNGATGLKSRWEQKYRGLGMQWMAAVYWTTSDHFRREMERDLTQFFRNFLHNRRLGGAGPDGVPPYITYVVW